MAEASILEERAAFERRVQRSSGAPGVLIVDVLNVTLGRRMDELLPMIAERVRQVVRDEDEIARVGNDQLGVRIDVDGVDMRSICDRIEEAVDAQTFVLDGEDLNLRVTASGASVDEAGEVGALALAYERNSARIQARHRQIYHEGPFNNGRGGSSVSTFEEWAWIVIDTSITGFGCSKAEYNFDGQTWSRGEEIGVAMLDLPISVAKAVRGRFRTWAIDPPPIEPGFVASLSAYLDENAERLVTLQAAQTDSLTGCYNRAGLAAALTHRQTTSVAIIDLDHFKLINDRFGHDAGDEVLAAFGQYLAKQCAPAVVARWGGEEFVVASEEPPARLAAALADLQKTVFEDRRNNRVTFSAGVAAVTNSWEPAVSDADAALLEAKQSRACVILHTDPRADVGDR